MCDILRRWIECYRPKDTDSEGRNSLFTAPYNVKQGKYIVTTDDGFVIDGEVFERVASDPPLDSFGGHDADESIAGE
jgi:hypothetical protein